MITPCRAIPPAVCSLSPVCRIISAIDSRAPLRVIFRGGALPGRPFELPYLKSGKPDVDDAVEQADHLGLLVSPQLLDERQLKAPLAGRKQRFQDGRQLRRGRQPARCCGSPSARVSSMGALPGSPDPPLFPSLSRGLIPVILAEGGTSGCRR